MRYILADEPTGSLDAKNAQIIMDILLSLNAEGKTVIIVAHDQKLKIRHEGLSNYKFRFERMLRQRHLQLNMFWLISIVY